MVVDMKHYIITIGVIFISLGIGIIIGFNMDGDDMYLTQQQLIDSLEDSFMELRAEGDNLRRKIEELEVERQKSTDFIEKFYHKIVNDKLTGLTIGILQTTENYYYNDIQEVLQEAGAIIPIHLSYTQKISNLTKEELENINHVLGFEFTKHEFINQVNNDVVDLLINNKKSNLLDYLVANEFIRLIDYEEYDNIMDQIILATGYQEQNKENIHLVDSDLIERLQNQGIVIIGMERSEVSYSTIPLYERKGIPTTNNVESLLGRISLIFLSSEKEENFGKTINKGVI